VKKQLKMSGIDLESNEMNNEKKDFDKEAAAWDENPGRVKLAQEIAQAINQEIVLQSDMRLLDFGCGTGLLSIELQSRVGSVTGVDSSPGMLDIFKAKIARLELNHIETVLFDFEKGETLEGSYDVVVSNMTLHHIKDIGLLFNLFYKITAPAGHLCIADLDLEDGQFHEDNTGVFHYGFDRTILREYFAKAGFKDIQETTATEVRKPVKDGTIKRFPVVLMTARKA
jgi:ubiquinone/menaquinone biosynthesis C-methylase UbiE